MSDRPPSDRDSPESTPPAGETPPLDPVSSGSSETPGESASPLHSTADDASCQTPPPPEEPTGRATFPTARRVRLGPGLLESLIWLLGVFVVQFAAAAVTVLVALFSHLTPDELANIDIEKAVTEAVETYSVEIVGGSILGFVLVAILATFLRLGRSTRRLIGLRPMPSIHVVQILLVMLPLAILSGTLHVYTTQFWDWLIHQVPWFAQFDSFQTIEMVSELVDRSSLALLFMVVAVGPAIGEELVFRGVIGRGLIARFNLLPGVMLTTVLFAAAHVHPAHALALIPLGLFIHFVYYTTRSIYGPIFLHLLNNSWALFALASNTEIDEAAAIPDQVMPPQIVATASLSIIFVASWMWVSRSRFVNAAGEEWSPGYDSLELPPANVDVIEARHTPSQWQLSLVAVALMSFYAFFLGVIGG